MRTFKKIFTMILILLTLLFYFTKTSLAYDQMYSANEKITPIPPEIISTREENMPVEKVRVRSVGKTMLLILLLAAAGGGAAAAAGGGGGGGTSPNPSSSTGTIGVSW